MNKGRTNLPTQPMEEHKDFAKWFALYQRKSHLTPYAISQLLQKQFGGPRTTWQARVSACQAFEEQLKRQRKRQNESIEGFVKEILGKPYPYIPPKKDFHKSPDRTKLVCVADPHEPYSLRTLWEEVLEKHHDAYHIHINGDLFDFYSKSRFRKIEGDEVFKDEIRAGFDRMEWLSTNFTRVTLIKGNHDNRTEKKIAEYVDADMLWLTERDIVRYLATFFDNVEVVGERVESGGETVPVEFIWQYKDMVFTHIERSQKQSSSLIDGIVQDLLRWSNMMRLKPFRWVIQGHNHRCAVEDLGTCYGMLIPMAGRITGRGLRYALSPSLRGKPPVSGYGVFFTENGKTDFNRSRPYIVEP